MFKVNVGGREVHFDDLNPDVFVEAAKADERVSGWHSVYTAPAASVLCARALVAKVAEDLGVEAPKLDTVRELTEAFTLAPLEDLPEEYEGPIPLVEGDPTTDG